MKIHFLFLLVVAVGSYWAVFNLLGNPFANAVPLLSKPDFYYPVPVVDPTCLRCDL